MKYVIIKVTAPVVKHMAIVFDEWLVHSDMFKKTREHICESMKVHPARVTAVGAGYVGRDWKVHGRSTSLNLESKREDELYL